jgi:hypothetical protein
VVVVEALVIPRLLVQIAVIPAELEVVVLVVKLMPPLLEQPVIQIPAAAAAVDRTMRIMAAVADLVLL